MDLRRVLTSIGLSEKEAQVYLVLLTLGEVTPAQIAKKAKIKRPTTYFVLQQLQEDGLVSRITKQNKEFYRALNPHILLDRQYQLYQKVKDSIPELEQLHARFSATPQMNLYEGKEGLVQIFEDSLTTKDGILAWINLELSQSDLFREYYPTYIEKRVKAGIAIRVIASYNRVGLEFKRLDSSFLRETKLVSEDDFPFQNEVYIYDNKVAMISHEDEIGVIIQNDNIANTQRSVFKMCFNYASQLEDTLLTDTDLTLLSRQDPATTIFQEGLRR